MRRDPRRNPEQTSPTDLDGFHGVVFVQFVDVVGDAGVERRGRNGVDDGGVVRLLLVALAVRVDQQGDQTAEDGAAEPHGDHVEEVEVWNEKERPRGNSLPVHTAEVQLKQQFI